jgi:CHAT domain-containing protein
LHTWQILHHRQSTEGNAALLVGIAEFRGRAPDLPNAIAALDLVERHWPTPVVRIEATAATRGALKTLSVQGALRRYRHMFFATHGQLVAASGLLAHLKLVDEDILYDDITQLQLEGALVVLAACDGALGEVLPGEEVLSLSRAFLSCGACDVIASLWPLYDSTILDLLELLYVALASGCDAPSAVVYAQRNLLRMNRVEDTEDSLVASPFVWGGMSAYGAGTARSGHTPNT